MTNPRDEQPYATIRDHIGYLIGKTLVEITQHDREDVGDSGEGCFVELHFHDGSWVRFYMGEQPDGTHLEHAEG